MILGKRTSMKEGGHEWKEKCVHKLAGKKGEQKHSISGKTTDRTEGFRRGKRRATCTLVCWGRSVSTKGGSGIIMKKSGGKEH